MSEYDDPIQNVFESLDIPYKTVDDVPGRTENRFMARYGAVEDGAVADAAQYAAVCDTVIEDRTLRGRFYRKVVAADDACYLPNLQDAVPSGMDPGAVADVTEIEAADIERDGLKDSMKRYMENRGTRERDWATFETAYENTKDRIESAIEPEEQSF